MPCPDCTRLEARVSALEDAWPAQSAEALARLAKALAPALAIELARLDPLRPVGPIQADSPRYGPGHRFPGSGS